MLRRRSTACSGARPGQAKDLLGDSGNRPNARGIRSEIDRCKRPPLCLDRLLVERDRAEDRHLLLVAKRLDRRAVRLVPRGETDAKAKPGVLIGVVGYTPVLESYPLGPVLMAKRQSETC